MTPAHLSFTKATLFRALRESGIAPGDIVFFHPCLEALGQLSGFETPEAQCQAILEAIRDAVGPAGTIVVPTYTFSFCRHEMFDVENTPTSGGPWSTSAGFLEYFRRVPGVRRSRDPIHSVCALGPAAEKLVTNVANTCFGKD